MDLEERLIEFSTSTFVDQCWTFDIQKDQTEDESFLNGCGSSVLGVSNEKR